MKTLLLALTLIPLFTHASNQDQLVIQDLDRSLTELNQIEQVAQQGGANLDLRLSYLVGLAGGDLAMAQHRAAGVFKSGDEDQKLLYGLSMFSDYFGKGMMGFFTQSEDNFGMHLTPGVADAAFLKAIANAKKGVEAMKAAVSKRESRSPSREYFERTLKDAINQTDGRAMVAEILVGLANKLPEQGRMACGTIAVRGAFSAQLAADYKYLVELDRRDAGSSAETLSSAANILNTMISRPDVGKSFCGISPVSVPGILVGKTSNSLKAVLAKDLNDAKSLQREIQKLKTAE